MGHVQVNHGSYVGHTGQQWVICWSNRSRISQPWVIWVNLGSTMGHICVNHGSYRSNIGHVWVICHAGHTCIIHGSCMGQPWVICESYGSYMGQPWVIRVTYGSYISHVWVMCHIAWLYIGHTWVIWVMYVSKDNCLLWSVMDCLWAIYMDSSLCHCRTSDLSDY